MGEWQDISSAPRDGTRTLLAYSSGDKPTDWDLAACRYGGAGWCFSLYGEVGSPIHFKPTHWMPLPEPPSQG